MSGGEPTLQEDLISFLRELQAMGFAVKLDTNGSNPLIVETLLSQNLVDYIAMDIKAPWDKYELLTGTGDVDIKAVQESIKLISAGGVKHHFRTTYALQFLKEDDIMAIRAGLPAGSPHIIQECNDG